MRIMGPVTDEARGDGLAINSLPDLPYDPKTGLWVSEDVLNPSGPGKTAAQRAGAGSAINSYSEIAPMNPSGLTPIEYNVIIDQNATNAITAGGLQLPDEVIEKRMHQETHGTIIAVSPMAFAFEDWPEGHPKPVAGDRVVFAQHAGAFIKGTDGKKYRVVKDKDIVAVIA